MICKACGHTNPDSAIFCVKCGAQLQSVESGPSVPPSVPSAPYPDSGNVTMPSLKHTTPPPAGQAAPAPAAMPPAYPPQGYPGQLRTQPSFDLIRRLPVIGGLLVLLGFLLPWAGNGSTGIDFFVAGTNALGYVLQNGASGVSFAQFLLFLILPLLSISILLAGIAGLLAALGKKWLRWVILILSAVGLLDFLFFVFLSSSFYQMPLGSMLGSLTVWVWIMLVGLVWMLITPWIGWKIKL